MLLYPLRLQHSALSCAARRGAGGRDAFLNQIWLLECLYKIDADPPPLVALLFFPPRVLCGMVVVEAFVY